MSAASHQYDVAQRQPPNPSASLRRLMSQFRRRRAGPMPGREFRAEAILAGAFLLVSVPLALAAPQHGSRSAGIVLLFVVLYAVTSRIEFDVGAGYGVPIQLVLVPMLFVLPAGWVPLVVAGSVVLGALPSVLAGTRHPTRVVVGIEEGWYALGPALVFALARLHTPRWSEWPLLLAALCAQLLCDV